jgi:hypothetical protein
MHQAIISFRGPRICNQRLQRGRFADAEIRDGAEFCVIDDCYVAARLP